MLWQVSRHPMIVSTRRGVVGLTLALPLQSRPALQWVATVVGTLAVYSLATRVIAASASAVGTAPSRSTRG